MEFEKAKRISRGYTRIFGFESQEQRSGHNTSFLDGCAAHCSTATIDPSPVAGSVGPFLAERDWVKFLKNRAVETLTEAVGPWAPSTPSSLRPGVFDVVERQVALVIAPFGPATVFGALIGVLVVYSLPRLPWRRYRRRFAGLGSPKQKIRVHPWLFSSAFSSAFICG